VEVRNEQQNNSTRYARNTHIAKMVQVARKSNRKRETMKIIQAKLAFVERRQVQQPLLASMNCALSRPYSIAYWTMGTFSFDTRTRGRVCAYFTRERKTTIEATLFNLRTFLRGGGRATGKPMRAIEAKIVRSLKTK